jgi:uroporphyrin-III C-methyltransferase
MRFKNGTKCDLRKRLAGKVFICGAGPGDPCLLTLKSAKLLKTCDVVLYDKLVSNKIIRQIPKLCKKICVGRESGDPTSHQDTTNRLMVKYAKKGNRVLRLKGGDPFIFGRGGEEAQYLREHNIQYEVVPGITSPIASAIYSGIPLTHRQYSSSVVIVTGHESVDKTEPVVKWKRLAKAVDTIVILMGVGRLRQISSDLIKAGMSQNTDVAVIERGTTERQRVVKGTLETIADVSERAKVTPPAIIIVGKVVSLQEKISWLHIKS